MAFSGTQQKCNACNKTVYMMDQLTADGIAYHKSCFKCSHCKGTLKLSNYSSLEGVLYCKPHFEQLFKGTGSFNKSFQSLAKSAEVLTPELTRSPCKAENLTPELTRSPSKAENLTPEQIRSPSKADNLTPELTRSPSKAENLTPELTRSHSKAEKWTPELARSASKVEKLTPELTRSPSKAAGMFLGTQEKCVACGKTAYPLEKVTVEEQSYHKSCFKCFHGGCALSPSNYAALEGILYCKPHFKQLFKEKGSYNHLVKCASVKRTTAPVPDL